jgi:hypothetical protein
VKTLTLSKPAAGVADNAAQLKIVNSRASVGGAGAPRYSF